MLRIISGPRTEEGTRHWRKLHNEELYNSYSLLSIITVIKPRRMRWSMWTRWRRDKVLPATESRTSTPADCYYFKIISDVRDGIWGGLKTMLLR